MVKNAIFSDVPALDWSDSDLLIYLAGAWSQDNYKNIVVIGRIRASANSNYGFLVDLHHANTGLKLADLTNVARVHEGIFIPPDELDRFRQRWGRASYALAELNLSPLERRRQRNDPLSCTVRQNSLTALSHAPESWGIKNIESDKAPLLLAMARMAIEERLEQETSAASEQLHTIHQEHEKTVKQHQQAQEDANARQGALNAEINRITSEIAASKKQVFDIENYFLLRREMLDKKIRDLQDLLRHRGERLVALDLVDKNELDILIPALEVADVREGHEFQKALDGDFSRLAPFIQARLWKKQMLFSQSQLRDFLALMRTHDLVVLAGDSGSGKTSLVKAVADSIGARCTVIPVKPNWTGPEDLLGYYNPIERNYQSTPFLKALQAAEKEPDVPHFICLDEMNLARVEYYFADFLSLLETREISPTIQLYTSDEERHVVVENGLFLTIEEESRLRAGMTDTATFGEMLKNESANTLLHQLGGFQDAESVLLHHARLRRALGTLLRTPTSIIFPANVRIIGAINIDETTHYLSPKILDRAHVLRFNNPILTDWDAIESELTSYDIDINVPLRLSNSDLGLRAPYPPYDRSDGSALLLTELVRRYLDPLGVEFGLRAIRQALGYLQAAKLAGISDQAALDNVVQHKILPKLMFDTSRLAVDGRNRRDILVSLRDEIASSLAGLLPEAGRETSIVALDRLIAAIPGNNGIANYWLR